MNIVENKIKMGIDGQIKVLESLQPLSLSKTKVSKIIPFVRGR